MNCIEFQQILEASIESRQPPAAPRWTEHLAACPDCRTRWEESLWLERAVALWNERTPVIDLTDRIVPRAVALHTADGPDTELPDAATFATNAGNDREAGLRAAA